MPQIPDILFIGDSHIPALKAGANALQIPSEAIQISGRFWHLNRVKYGGRGLFSPPNFPGHDDIMHIKKTYTIKNVVKLGSPIITTAGYHLGGLSAPLSWRPHLGVGADRAPGENDIILSSQFLEEYIYFFRNRVFYMLSEWSKIAPVLIVPPPRVKHVANFLILRDKIIEIQRSLGLKVYDPADDFAGSDGLIPSELLAKDQVHGNAAYGKLVMETIASRELIQLPASTS